MYRFDPHLRSHMAEVREVKTRKASEPPAPRKGLFASLKEQAEDREAKRGSSRNGNGTGDAGSRANTPQNTRPSSGPRHATGATQSPTPQAEQETAVAAMEWVEITAKTVEEAKELALDQLGVDLDEAEFEVLEEPKAGLFGRVRGEARGAGPCAADDASLQGRLPQAADAARRPPSHRRRARPECKSPGHSGGNRL